MSIDEAGTRPTEAEPGVGIEEGAPGPREVATGDEIVPPGEALQTNPFAAPGAGPYAIPAIPEKAQPVRAAERVASVDVLRGMALLGILAINIVCFAWPGPAWGNPLRGGGFTGTDRGVWWFNHLVFEMKMMTTFSMLFGAGLVLMGDRADQQGRWLVGVYYRRCLWLIAIGLVHSYFIWSGDILVLYGECGLLLYPFRHWRPRGLIVAGLLAMSAFVPVLLGIGAGLDWLKANAARVEAKEKTGQAPGDFEKRMREVWVEQVQPEVKPDEAKKAEKWAKELETYRGGYLGIVKDRAKELWIEQTIGFVLGGLWLAGGRMLVGMGLMKLGVFSASRSRSFYLGMMALGYGVGLPLVARDANALIRHRFEIDYLLHGGIFLNYYGSLVVALGHVGLVMLIYQSGALTWLTRRLAAVGRMALSNYLAHSIVCTTIFYGYGFGYFGTINRTGLAGIVLAIWAAQLVLSPIWLKSFRYGPAEWAWRSLTYGKPQPLRREAEPVII